MTIKCYNDIKDLATFEERFDYLKLFGNVGEDTFGFDRVFNQMFYRSQEWKQIRNFVITRDNGCDLATPGCEIPGKILVHHMNPISIDDIRMTTDFLLNPNYLITVSFDTHNALHYGSIDNASRYSLPERSPNDTKLW